MRIIKLTDGTVYPVDRCGATPETLVVNITSGDTMLALVTKFSVPENLTRIEHSFEGTSTDHRFFDGYTALTSAYVSETGTTLTLTKG